MYNQQYIPNNAGYPNYDTSTAYDTQMRRYHQDTSTQKSIYQHQNMASLPTSSPTPSNVSDTSQHSIMDLFEDNQLTSL